MILASPDSIIVEQTLYFSLRTSNNKMEYEALLAVLKLARDLGVRHLKALNDSQLVVGQVHEYKTNSHHGDVLGEGKGINPFFYLFRDYVDTQDGELSNEPTIKISDHGIPRDP